MIAFDSALVELKSQRAQLEIQVLGMRRRLPDLDAERANEVRAEIQRAESQVAELEQRVTRLESDDVAGGADDISMASLRTSAELDQLRSQILDALRGLVDPLQQHSELAERQRRLAGRLRDATGKDTSYATYVDTALVRVGDVDQELELVLDVLKRIRPVS